jgi:GH35 family endo-1,4-beta-xylanase
LYEIFSRRAPAPLAGRKPALQRAAGLSPSGFGPMLPRMSMNRRMFLRQATGAAALALASPPLALRTAETSEDDATLLAQSRERIVQHRQSPGAVVLRDARGRPVTRARIRIEQVRHEFLFGCNFFLFGRAGNPELEAQYRERFAALLNYCTLPFYWASYEPQRGHPDYPSTERVVDWCARHGILCKGHPLAWDHPAGAPGWLPDDPAQVEPLSLGRVREIVRRFKGRIDIWDVVNEATHLPQGRNNTPMTHWGKAIGPVEFVRRHLRAAREANPDATLLVNDYRTDPPYERILAAQREEGRWLFDVIGIQSHMHGGVWPARKVLEICDRYARLQRPIHFTETTIVSGARAPSDRAWGPSTPEGEARQAEETERFYTLLFGHPAVKAITWWDFSDRGAWQGAPAGWLRRDMSPKPVYERLRALIKGQWWTRREGEPDAAGEFPARAFHGRHRITVELPGGATLHREVDWRAGAPNRFVFTMG